MRIVDVENENLRNLFAQTPEMFCILIGPEHTFEYVNEAHIKALGFDATGMKVRVAQPESVEVHGILDDVYRTGVTAHLHEIAVTLGDRIRYFDLTYAARKSNAGEVKGIMILGAEVTNRVIANQIIKKSRLDLYRILMAAPASVAFLKGPELIFEFANLRYTQMIGREENLTGKSLRDVLPEMGEDVHLMIEEVYKTGAKLTETEFPVTINRTNGPVKGFYNFSIEPLKDEHGKTEGLILFVYEVTEEIILRKELEEKLEELNQEKESTEQFVSLLTHDLRNPLSAAKMSAQTIARYSYSPEKITSFTGRIVDNLNRADQMIENLLDFNRIKAGGKLQLKMESVKLLPLIQDTLLDLATVHGDRFNFSCNEKEITGVWSAEGIRRIVENLCTNAVKYGSAHTPIDINIVDNQSEIILSVHNLGEAISKAEQGKLFDPYQRTESASADQITGWGLGLTLVRGVAEAHGGEAFVKSFPGEGTTFAVKIPRMRS